MKVGISHIEFAEDVLATFTFQAALREHVTGNESASSPLHSGLPGLEPVKIKINFKKKKVKSSSIERARERLKSQAVVDLRQIKFQFFEIKSVLGGAL